MMDNEEPINLDNSIYYINRELSLLEFQKRVLEEVMDESNPLLERVKFLAILGSNLDEFFMVRVGGLIMQKESGVSELSVDGLTPIAQLAEIRKVALDIMEDARDYLHARILPELDQNGIHILNYDQLNEKQKESVNEYYNEIAFPVLTPLAFDPGHPFPHISNLSLNLAILIRSKDGQKHFARLKLPVSLPQLIPIKRSSGGVRKNGTVPNHHYLVWLSQVITANLPSLFPGMEIIEAHPFHVTRNADIEIQELEALDLLESIEENVRKRRFGAVTRLMVYKDMPKHIRDLLASNLKVDSYNIYALKSPLSLQSLSSITKIDRHDLKDKPFIPTTPSVLKHTGEKSDSFLFSVIQKKNILLHHPYYSFMPVVDFLETAAKDPQVLAIKQTLYRVGSHSPIVKALLQARRDYGKQVAVLVELKARFDEESNIGWARMLEQEGVHVIYGLLGLKTHSKIALVVRQEGDHIRRYVHLSTGNYNHVTAQLYEDIGMFTCDDDIGADATDLFNYLTGYSLKDNYRKLLVAPINLRPRIEELIQREIQHQKNGEQGYLIFKANSLIDMPIIKLLYQASMAGVKVDLIIRGMCSLKPGIPGLSENIRVISILGRYLEHSRIYYFRNGGKEEILMGSADIMPRNLDQRVEVLYPVEDAAMIEHIRNNILMTYLEDNVKARLMQPDGSYLRLQPTENSKIINAQDWFINHARHSAEY